MRQEEIALLGKITASISHDMNNVLATINESSGLLMDVVSAENNHSPKKDEITRRALSSIQRQITRGVEISSRLNRFAHSMDEPVSTVDVHELLLQMAFITGRHCELQRVQLSLELSRQLPPLRTSPFRLALVLAACIFHCLERLQGPGTILIQPRTKNRTLEFQMIPRRDSGTQPEDFPSVNELAWLDRAFEILKARLEPLNKNGLTGLKLLLPLSAEDNPPH